jgi:predicted Zn finger-like uncharacterized protein
MLIVCPSCATAYRIALSALGAAGRSVRCARCRHVWFASLADLAATALTVPGRDGASLEDKSDPPASAPVSVSVDAGRHADHDSRPGLAPEEQGVDALTVADAPSLIPAVAQDQSPSVEHAASGPDIETVAARRSRRGNETAKRRLRLPRPGLPAIIVALALLVAALVNWRTSVAHVLPQTASLFSAIGLPVNTRGLSLDSVKTSVESHEGVMVLVVQGTITNLTRQPQEVPRLRFAVCNEAGYEVYAWTALPAQQVLAPGDTAPFRTRLASPPADARQVVVRFFNRHDAASAN